MPLGILDAIAGVGDGLNAFVSATRVDRRRHTLLELILGWIIAAISAAAFWPWYLGHDDRYRLWPVIACLAWHVLAIYVVLATVVAVWRGHEQRRSAGEERESRGERS